MEEKVISIAEARHERATTPKESFEARRDECMAFVNNYWSKPPPLTELLTKQILDPKKAYKLHVKKWAAYKEVEKLKTWIYSKFYNELGKDLFSHPLWSYLNNIPWSTKMHTESCSLAPEVLKEVGWKDGDELWEWRTPDKTWEHMCGLGGYAIIRNGKVTWSMITEEN